MASSIVQAASPRLVLADDDEIVRILARAALEQEGFIVFEAADGATALDLIREHAPQIILLDVKMPQMDGFETCAAIRSDPSTEHIPVLMMTGLEDVESIDRAYSMGATDFISKPINWSILRHRLRYILRSSQMFWDLRTNQDRLSNAQRIARLGDWVFDLRKDEFDCSDEIMRIFELDGMDRREFLEMWPLASLVGLHAVDGLDAHQAPILLALLGWAGDAGHAVSGAEAEAADVTGADIDVIGAGHEPAPAHEAIAIVDDVEDAGRVALPATLSLALHDLLDKLALGEVTCVCNVEVTTDTRQLTDVLLF